MANNYPTPQQMQQQIQQIGNNMNTEFGAMPAENLPPQAQVRGENDRSMTQAQKNEQMGVNISFRGKPIPEIAPKQNYQLTDSQTIIDRVKNMTPEELQTLTIVAIHVPKWQISEVKLSTGDIIDVETAIALAENDYLVGFSTGATRKGGKTLRTRPLPDEFDRGGIYDLPRF